MIDLPGFFALLNGLMAGLVAFGMASSYSRGVLRAPLERIFFLFSGATVVWNGAYAAMGLLPDEGTALAVYRVSSIAWGANPSVAMYYAYRLYCRYAKRPVSRRMSALIFAPTPFIIFGVFSGRLLAVGLVRSPFGWLERMDPSSWWNYAFIAVMLAGLVSFTVMGVRLIGVSGTNRARFHGRLITFPVAAIILLVLVFHIVLPMLGLQSFPPVIQQLVALWIVALTLIRDRYPVLSLNPLNASDAIVAGMSELCVLIDADGIVRGANPPFGELIGMDARAAVGREAEGTLPSSFAEILARARTAPGGRLVAECVVAQADGSEPPFSVTVRAVKDALDDPVGHVLIAREIREEKRLLLLSETDALTGIYNRRKMEESIGAALAGPRKRRRRPLAAIMIDIDHFKRVNDRFGHETGDKVIVDFCSVVRSSIRGNDLFARWGGEEFVVLCSDTRKEEAAVLAERIRRRTEACAFDCGLKVTVSLGVAAARAGDVADSLIRRADEAMYAAKSAGRNRVVLAPDAEGESPSAT